MELLKCHHGDRPRDISIQVLQQENKYIAGLGWAGAPWPWGQEDWSPEHPSLSLPTWAQVPAQGQLLLSPPGVSLSESPWSCPLEQGLVWAHVALSLLLDQYSRHPMHSVKMLFIYTQTKFCSELVLIYGCAAVCVQPWKYWIYWLC